jgi:uncharacterized protein (DUF4213/DUF364 family)
MKTANFFDINTLITINSKVWIIDKLKPNIPIVKISKSEFNLLNNRSIRRIILDLLYQENILGMKKN